ncbi:DUF4255 domain-containing protein [Roseovarius spongiae]|uniref:DUF4255 domain-containing protein n=1 Tax=Roseovarius spongiae TaxID=2320272 RepID=A0A3A8AV26_9RHOB|nr:DUF4255 domain-containing protein [Roseovarius spongiae]RKF14897.1 DUF4255 domain-containing protein [Roseovarius spongiae]
MADSSAISHVSQSLRAILLSTFTDAGPFVGTTIDLRSPREIGTPAGGANTVSLWLYRVQRFGELENAPPTVNSDGRLVPAPLALTLHYLVTPLTADEVTAHRLLGHAMQALNAHARVGPEFTHAGLSGRGDEPLAVHLEKQSFEDSLRIWQALNEPYRLSVPYFVQYVAIESSRSFETAQPVTERNVDYRQIIGVS